MESSVTEISLKKALNSGDLLPILQLLLLLLSKSLLLLFVGGGPRLSPVLAQTDLGDRLGRLTVDAVGRLSGAALHQRQRLRLDAALTDAPLGLFVSALFLALLTDRLLRFAARSGHLSLQLVNPLFGAVGALAPDTL